MSKTKAAVLARVARLGLPPPPAPKNIYEWMAIVAFTLGNACIAMSVFV